MTGMRLRPLQISDTSRVLEAFTSAGDVARQGRVTDPLEAEAYVARLLDPDAAHLPFAMAGESDLLFGLVALSVDSGNRNAWFLRLQEVTLNYTMRTKYLRHLGVSGVDFQLIGSNLLVWDSIKQFDPEQAGSRGLAYPIPATYTLQLYLHF